MLAILTETFFLTAKQHQNQKIKLGSSSKNYENINLIFFKKTKDTNEFDDVFGLDQESKMVHRFINGNYEE